MKRWPWKFLLTKKAFQNTINNQQKSREENNYNPVLEPCWGVAG